MCRTACTEPQCLYKGVHFLLLITKRYNLYKTSLLNHFLPTISILCYFLPITYVHALYVFQTIIFPTCFRSSN